MSLDPEDLQEIIEDFLAEATELLEQLDQDLVALEEKADAGLVNKIFRSLHTIKGTANFLNSDPLFAALAQVAHAAEDVMGELRSEKISLSPPLADAVLQAVDTIKNLFTQVHEERKPAYNYSELVAKLRSFATSKPDLESGIALSNASKTLKPQEPIPKEQSTESLKPIVPEASPKEIPETSKPARSMDKQVGARQGTSQSAQPKQPAMDEQVGTRQVISQSAQPKQPIAADDSGLDEQDVREIIDDFVTEASELLEKLDQDLVALEEKQTDTDLINSIFRSLHTIKGTANFLVREPIFAAMAKVAHAAEDVMGGLRGKKMSLSQPIMDAVLQSVDAIKNLFSNLTSSEKFSYDPGPLVLKLRQFLICPELSEHTTLQATMPTQVQPSPKSIAQEQPKPPTVVSHGEPPDTQKAATLSTSDMHRHEVKTTPEHTGNTSLSQDEELMHDFLEESKELVEKIDNILMKLEQNSNDSPRIEEIFRYVHTLKGTSSFLGFGEISQVAHLVEDILKEVKQHISELTPALLATISQVVDVWKRFFTNPGDRASLSIPQSLMEQLSCFSAQRNMQQAETDEKASVSLASGDSAKQMVKDELLSSLSKVRKIGARSEQTIRVEANRLNTLMNLGGELILGRNRMVQVAHEVVEKLSDEKLCQALIAAVDGINYVTAELQMAVLKTRMQPIGKIFGRFNRTVRDLGRDLGKEVILAIYGSETELDKSIIDELGDPLTHLLRNSVDHGIETPDVRMRIGKPRTGTITLSAFQEGNQIIIEIRDDGKGMNLDAIKTKAISMGFITPSEAERLSIQQIIDFIFLPGFSTVAVVTNVSGRGVGMDVVKNSIEKLNGSIEVFSEQNKGCIFKLRFPLTLATIQVLQVKVRSEIFAIPVASVIETLRLHPHQLPTISGKPVIRFRDTLIPLIYLDEIFEMESETQHQSDKIYIVVIGIAEKKIGIVVDKIIRQEEIVMKSLGKLLSNIAGISGACIGGDGRVILILDVASLLRSLPRSTIMATAEVKKTAALSQPERLRDKPPAILVVEDSRSERKRTRLLLEAKGFKALEAIDGKDALNKLTDYPIDMVITDIEMPGLDGYQLTAKIREHWKYRNIPVIAVSSHKEMVDRIKGMEAGINTYLPKPVQENDLFNAIGNLFSNA